LWISKDGNNNWWPQQRRQRPQPIMGRWPIKVSANWNSLLELVHHHLPIFWEYFHIFVLLNLPELWSNVANSPGGGSTLSKIRWSPLSRLPFPNRPFGGPSMLVLALCKRRNIKFPNNVKNLRKRKVLQKFSSHEHKWLQRSTLRWQPNGWFPHVRITSKNGFNNY